MSESKDLTEAGPDPLDRMVCFALYAAARATNRRYISLLAPWGLTYPQYLVLVLLWSHRSLAVKEVAEHLMLDSGTTSPLIKRLELRGYIARERSATDERAVIVTLTDSGVALKDELAHIQGCLIEATQLTQTEGKAALSLLHDLTHRLSGASAVGDNPVERPNS
ncbi:MarR family transcriptional regulator [Arthrobacter sp. LAPM80]|uniref:MarR family winged helix-turn-helix transcriptional regulator n=1 Tax=Arthrobacter sp. LAPM80 TaxID=3141788 RepID=UPI00398A8984